MAIIQNLEAFVQSYPAGLDSVTDLQLSQNENGRQIRFTIGGVTIPAGSVATISGTKPDGVVYSNTGTIEGADTVIFDEDVQMTAVFGTWYAKIRITNAGNAIASARVRFIIDKDPVDAGAIPSESQLDGLVAEAEEYAEAAEDAAERAAINYGSPLIASTAAAMTDINRVYVYTGSESGYTYGNWYYYNGSTWTSGGIYNSAAVETDTTLTESGVPADAEATGDKIAELKDDLEQMSSGVWSGDAKAALMNCFTHVAWIDEHGQDYYDALAVAMGSSTYWDFEWYAESEELPTGMTYKTAEFIIRNGEKLLKVASPNLDFDFVGDCELEIEGKWEVFDSTSTYWKSDPQLIVVAADYVTEGKDGFKTYCLTAQNNTYVYTNVSGSTQATQIDGADAIRTYNLKFENESGLLKVDGNVVASGDGVSNNAYLLHTGIYSGYADFEGAGMIIKSIKFRRMKAYQEDPRHLPTNYTWLYDATNGQLLSAQNYVSEVTSGSNSETMINNQLVLNSPPAIGSTQNYIRYNLVDTTATNAKLSARVKINEIATSVETSPGAEGFRLQLSNGTEGAQLFINSQPHGNTHLGAKCFEGTNKQYIDLSDYDSSEYHIIEVELKNGVQKAYIDGNLIFTSSTLSTNYCSANAILNQRTVAGEELPSTITTVDWIAYYEVS